MNYDAEFCQQIRVSEDEKRQCLELISEIINLSNKGRNYGLLSLGQEAEDCSSFLLSKGLQLAMDGVKAQTARTILELYILTGDYTGQNLLERCIILEGVMGILEGMHPKLLKELLLSFLGESGHALYREEFGTQERTKLSAYLNKIENTSASTKSGAKLGKIINALDGQATKQLLKEINIGDLAKALTDMDGRVQIRLFEHLPERGAFLLLEALEQINSTGSNEILEAQKKVARIISGLREQRMSE